MKFSVGYQQDTRERWIPAILAQKDRVAEIYFPWGGLPNGRSPDFQPQAQARMRAELTALTQAGIERNLLLNGMCYGGQALSKALFEKINRSIEELGASIGLQSVTTTSPVIAEFLKTHYPALEIRASVNMDLGHLEGMKYLTDCFDSFYIGRVVNRRLDEIARMKAWADARGKGLCILLNSGCLARCPTHTFHDNLVSHEAEIAATENAVTFRALCRQQLAKEENRVALIADTSYVRPEDLSVYGPFFPVGKLATRVNPNPSRVLNAYARGTHYGNLLDLLEPDFSDELRPYILDSRAFPTDFAQKTGHCDRQCESCGYCDKVYKVASKRVEV